MYPQKKIKNGIKKTQQNIGMLDVIIVTILLVVIIISLIIINPSKNGEFVEIYHNNTLLVRLSLDNDIEYILNIDGPVHIVVENHYVFVSDNNCKNQICVNSPKISKAGQSILCAPKRLIVVIKSGQTEKVYVTG